MKQYLVYVDIPVIATERHAIIVNDEADLKSKLLKREEEFRKISLVYKPLRDKAGKIQFYDLSKDWN